MQRLHPLPPDDDPRWRAPGTSLELASSHEPAGLDDPDADETARRRRPGAPVEPARVLRTLRAGRWWLLGAAAAGVIAGALVAKLAVRHTYQASASLRFEGVESLEDTHQGDGAPTLDRDLPSHVESLRRDPVLREVRERMGMARVPLAAMRAMLTTTSEPLSGMVAITATSDSPERAARLANTLAEVFVAHERERRRVDVEGAIGALDGRIRTAQAELQLARTRYDAFRGAHGLTDLTTEQEAALAQATSLRAQADLAVAEIASTEARVRELRDEVRRTPRMEVVASQSESVDEQELARAEAHLGQIRGTLSGDHPRLQVAERQVRALRERVRSGRGTKVTGTVSTGASQTYETAQAALSTAQADLEEARRRSVELARLADEAQQRVTGFSAIEGEATALLADVQVKETLLNALSNTHARLLNLREHADPGFRTVAAAVEPESAVASHRKYLVAAAIPAVMLLLAALALLSRELRGLRMHTAAEVCWWGKGPVVGTTTWPRDPEASEDLVADLDDSLPEARGTMLIVGATEREGPLAHEIARRLAADWSESTLVEPAASASDPGVATALLGASYADLEVAPHAPGSAIAVLGPEAMAGTEGRARALRARRRDERERLIVSAWTGAATGQQLRRAARLADRVLVVVPSGAISAMELAATGNRLGRKDGVGFVVVGVADQYASLPDRAGPCDRFWAATKSTE